MQRYTTAGSHVIAETFPDEIVVVNLETGLYYSFDTTARDVWTCITQGCSVDETVRYLANAYDTGNEDVPTAVATFVDTLVNEHLVKSSEPGQPGQLPASPPHKASYGVPKLNRYSDMEQLLLLDPIHDVDASGWPVAAAPPPG